MFLWQKFKYNTTIINEESNLSVVENMLANTKGKIVAWDTETTGLHIVRDKPFLLGFGFDKNIFIMKPEPKLVEKLYEILKRAEIKYFLAHNAKFDYHMMRNAGCPIPVEIPVADTLSLARLTDYVDTMDSYGLEALGGKHVSEDSKFAAKVIKEHLNAINKARRTIIKEYVRDNVDISYTLFMEMYNNRVQFVETPYDKHFDEVDKIAGRANYEDSYNEKPTLMTNYLADDIVLVLELFSKLSPVLDVVDKDRRVWHRENKMIRVVGDMESRGMRADVKYLLASRSRVAKYKNKKYEELTAILGQEISVGQHALIKKIFAEKYKIGMLKTDMTALEEVQSRYDGEAVTVAKLIIEIRTLDKWLSTYINGMLNRIHDGNIYTDINNSGTVTGRVSSDLQQQPKDALTDDDGNELFHPRKVFITRDGYTNYYLDFNNMEMRVQAYYTYLVGGGDLNLCRAFMPFKCTNYLTGEEFDPTKHLDEWNSGEWVLEDGSPWKKTDLHTATTLQAFPDLKLDDPDFDSKRQLGKRVNFLKNYGGGKIRIMESLGLSEEVAEALNSGYYRAFPKVLDYQKWVENQVNSLGFVENLYGRRYYFSDARWAYKAYNYLVQGSCADYVKEKEIQISELLAPYESSMLLPVHDEIIFEIKEGEEFLVPKIKAIMEDSKSIIKTVPMVSTVERSKTNWAEAEEVK